MKNIFTLLFAVVFATTAFAQKIDIQSSNSSTTSVRVRYTTAGSHTVDVGRGVTSANVSMWGGGGGGASSGARVSFGENSVLLHSGGGGGGSNWAGNTVSLVSGTSYPFTVGSGGLGGLGGGIGSSPNKGGNGTASNFSNLVVSPGGYGAVISNLTNEGNDGGAQGDAPTPLNIYESATKGSPDYSVWGGGGGKAGSGRYGASGYNIFGSIGMYQGAWGITTGGSNGGKFISAGTNPGYGGGGGAWAGNDIAYELMKLVLGQLLGKYDGGDELASLIDELWGPKVAQVTTIQTSNGPGGNGADGMVDFYITFSTYKLSAINVDVACGPNNISAPRTVRLSSETMENGTYGLMYTITDQNGGGIQTLTTSAVFNNGESSFQTPSLNLSGSYKITVTQINSGNSCVNNLTENNTALIQTAHSGNDWTYRPQFPGIAREDAVSFIINNKVYVGTGFDGTSYHNDFWELDLATNVWTQKAPFPGEERSAAVAFTIGNKGYVTTGRNGSKRFKDTYQYDPISNSWLQKENFPGTPRSGAVAFTIDNYGFVGTGYDGFYKNDFYRYDQTTNNWTIRAAFPGVGRHEAVGFSYLQNGFIGLGKGAFSNKDFYYYDSNNNQWRLLANSWMPELTEAVAFVIGSKAYIAGGRNSSTIQNKLYELDLTSITEISSPNWVEKATLLTPLKGAIGFSDGIRGYIGIGLSNASYTSGLQEYYPSSHFIQMGELPKNICAGTTFNVPFTVGCNSFGAGNEFTVVLGYLGKFIDGSVIGTRSGGSTEPIEVTIPSDLSAGSDYSIRIEASSPGVFSSDNGGGIVVSPLPASTQMSVNASGFISCSGGQINLTAINSLGNVTIDTSIVLDENFNNGVGNWTQTNNSFGRSTTYTTGFNSTASYTPITTGETDSLKFAVRPSGFSFTNVNSVFSRSGSFSGYEKNTKVITTGDNSSFLLSKSNYPYLSYIPYGSNFDPNNPANSDADVIWWDKSIYGDIILQSPVFSLVGYDSAELSFQERISETRRDLEVSVDGVNWVVLDAGQFIPGDDADYWVDRKYDLTQFSQSPNVLVRFKALYERNELPFVAIDNFKVEGYKNNQNYTWTSSPAGFTSNLQNPVVNPTVNTKYFCTTSNNYGCESTSIIGIDSVSVNVKQPSATTVDIAICPSALPFTWNGLTLTSAGTSSVLLINAAGCDSTVTLNLSLKREPTNNPVANTPSVCNTSLPISLYAVYPIVQSTNSYEWSSNSLEEINDLSSNNPTEVKITETTTFQLISTDAVTGCSNTKSVIVTVNNSGVPFDLGTIPVTICSSELPYTSYGMTFNGTDTQTTTFTAEFGGCDTTVTVALTVRETSFSNVNKTICESELPFTWNQLTFNSAGTQTAHFTNSVGCDSTATLNLSIRTGVNFSGYTSIQETMVSCFGGNSGSAQINITDAPTPDPFGFKWDQDGTVSNTDQSSTLSGLLAGNYTCTITDKSSCKTIVEVVITEPDRLRTSLSLLETKPYLSSTTKRANVDGGTFPYQFAWSPSGGNAAESDLLCVGNYSLLVTDAKGCTASINEINVVQNPALESVTVHRICNAGFPYTWNNLTLEQTGTYSVNLTSATGCDSIAVLNLLPSEPDISELSVDQTICEGSSIDLFSKTALNDSTVIWTENFNAPSNDWQTSFSSEVGNIAASRWSLVNYGYCFPFYIRSNDESYFYNSSSFRQNGSVTTQPGEVTNTQLESPSFSTVGISNPHIRFEHFLYLGYEKDSISMQVTDDNGSNWTTVYNENPTSNIGDCQEFTTQLVSLKDYLNKSNLKIRFVYYSVNGNSWSIDNVSLISYAPMTYAWSSTPAGFVTNSESPGLVSPTVSTTYILTATNATTACISTQKVDIIVRPTINTSVSDSICTGESYLFEGDSLTSSGTYTKHLFSIAGCDSIVTLNLKVRTLSKIESLVFTTQNVTCYGGTNGQASVEVIGGIAPYTYNWHSSGGDRYYAPSPMPQGQYMVTVKDANQCAATATVAIFEPDTVLVSLHLNFSQNNATADVIASPSGGTAPYSYTWLPNVSISDTAKNLPPGIYSAIVTDANGCTSENSILVPSLKVEPSTTFIRICTSSLPYSWNGVVFTETGAQTAELTAGNGSDSLATLVLDVFDLKNYIEVGVLQEINCYDGRGKAYASAFGGQSPYSFSWSKSGDVGYNRSTQIVTTLSPANYVCTITDANNCVGVSEPVTITQPTPLTALVIAGSLQNCGLTYIAASGGTEPYSYFWSDASGGIDSIAPQGVESDVALFPNVRDSKGCLNEIGFTKITYPDALSSTTNSTICSGSLPYKWNGLTFAGAGSKTASLNSYFGCDSSATLNLTIADTIRTLVDKTVCQNNLPYAWNGYTFTEAGSKTMYLQNRAGCDSSVVLRLSINPSQSGSVTASASSTSICQDNSVNLYATEVQDLPATILTENFNSATNNWTQINLSTGPDPASTAWSLKPSGHIGYYNHTYSSGDNSQLFFCSSNSNSGSGDITNAILQSPAFSTIGYSAATLSFLYDFRNFSNGNLKVLISSDSLNWTPVFTRSSNASSGSTTTTPTLINIGNAFLNKPIVYIRYQLNGTYREGAAVEAFIDNVIITGTPIATTYSWMSDDGSFNSNLRNPTPVSPTQSTVYTVTASTGTGCEFTHEVSLTVKPKTSSVTTASICSGSTYAFNGTNYTSAGNYEALLTNSVGCDSTAVLQLTVTPSVVPTLESFTASATTFSPGSAVTFTAVPNVLVNSPYYTWYKN
ncbi:MAG: N-acetylneuraminic acid mutarotase, partial [Spirosomataceae bacterium]